MKKLKNLLIFVIMLAVMISIIGCGKKDYTYNEEKAIAIENIKIGVVYPQKSDEDSGLIHRESIEKAVDTLKIDSAKIVTAENVKKDESCVEVFNSLASDGCNIIFVTSPEYENYIGDFVKENPKIYVSVFKGSKINSTNLDNFYGKTYKAQFLAGVTAGLKTVSKKVGYIMTDNSWQSIADCDGFALGLKLANPSAVLIVRNLEGNNTETAEIYATSYLSSAGCDLLFSDTYSDVVCTTAEKNNIMSISNGRKTQSETEIASIEINWKKYYLNIIKSVIKGTYVPYSYFGDVDDDIFEFKLSEKHTDVETQRKVRDAKNAIENGFEVFKGIVTDNNGKEKIGKDEVLKDSEIKAIDWYVNNVEIK